MKMTFGSVVVCAGLTGVLSFSCLTLAIGSEYWYIIEDQRTNHTDPPHTHSGLWVVTDGMTLFLVFLFSLLPVKCLLLGNSNYNDFDVKLSFCGTGGSMQINVVLHLCQTD